jgi:hypothetical protein
MLLGEEPEGSEEGAIMKVRCLLGRHKWRVDTTDPEHPFEVCDRCGHYRSDSSWTDLTAEANMRPMDPSAGSGGGGI